MTTAVIALIFVCILLVCSAGLNIWLSRQLDTAYIGASRIATEKSALLLRNRRAENKLLLAHLEHEPECQYWATPLASCTCGTSEYNAVLADVLVELVDPIKGEPNNEPNHHRH